MTQTNAWLSTDAIGTIFFSSLSAFIALYNWKGARFRTKLKDDLEILKRYREEYGAQPFSANALLDDLGYRGLREKVKRNVLKAYVFRRESTEIVTAAGFGAFAVAVAFLPLSMPRGWRLTLVALFVAAGLLFALDARRDRKKLRPYLKPNAGPKAL